MYYASVSLLAILILFISNRDIIFNKNEKDKNQINAYRNFLLGVLAYYIIDVLWGVFDFFSLTNILYVDTVAYFIAMGIAVLLWSKYVVTYLEKKTFYSRALVFSVQLLLLGEVILIIVNFFTPILFYYNDEGEYLAGFARYVLLILHAVTFLLTSVYTLLMMRKQNEAMKVRYHAIGIFGIIMLVLITSQIFNSSLPFYAVGFLLGSCLLHSFVIEGEKEEYRQELEKALEREKKQKQELDTSRRLAYTDPLTGIRNKMAYLEVIEGIDNRIKNGEVLEFAIAVFDINRLKIVNDTLGHENGDQYIINGCRIICSDFIFVFIILML